MKELKCPKCGNVFTVDESDYADIVNQVKTKEFQAEVDRRMKEMEDRQALQQQADSLKAEQQLQAKQLEFAKQLAAKETLQRLRREPQFIDAIFAAKANRTKMEEEPVMAAPDIDKLQEENEQFIIEQEKPVEPVLQPEGRIVARNAVPQQQTTQDDEFTLDDIIATPREKTREEIIAEAEAAAFAEE